MADNALLDQLIQMYRHEAILANEIMEKMTFTSKGIDEDNYYISRYNERFEAACLVLDKIGALGDEAVRAAYVCLSDPNLHVRLIAANSFCFKHPAENREVLVAIAEMQERSIPGGREDSTISLAKMSARLALWSMKHGSWDGYWDAPEKFWRKEVG